MGIILLICSHSDIATLAVDANKYIKNVFNAERIDFHRHQTSVHY